MAQRGNHALNSIIAGFQAEPGPQTTTQRLHLTVAEACSEFHPVRHYPSTQSVPAWSIDGYSSIVMPAGTDIALNGEDTLSISGGTGAQNIWVDTIFPCQRFDSSVRAAHAPTILGLDSVGPIVSDVAHADHTGAAANRFPSSGIQSSGDRHPSSHITPGYKESVGPAPCDKGMPDSPALYPSCEVAYGSLETQHECLGDPQAYPQLSLEPIKRRATVPISRSTTSPKQSIRGRTGRYSCGICGGSFVQLQGARRHHREQHEPRTCPHCHAFRWGRPYLFRKHLKMEHPEIDPEAAILDTARNPKGAIATRDLTFHHIPLSKFTSVHRRFGDIAAKYPTTLSPLARSTSSPDSPPLDPHVETLDIISDDARTGALRPLQGVETTHGCGLPLCYRAKASGAVTTYEVFGAPREIEITNESGPWW